MPNKEEVLRFVQGQLDDAKEQDFHLTMRAKGNKKLLKILQYDGWEVENKTAQELINES